MGFSQEYSGVFEDDRHNGDGFQFINDAFPFLNLILKEMVETIGSNKEIFHLAESSIKKLLSNLYNCINTNEEEPDTNIDKNTGTEWVSCNARIKNHRPNKKQRYYLSQG